VAVLGGYAISPSTGDSGSSVTSTTFANFSAGVLSCDLVTSGKPVYVALIPDQNGLTETNPPNISSGSGLPVVRIFASFGAGSVASGQWNGSDYAGGVIRPGVIWTILQLNAGNYTFNLQAKSSSLSVSVVNCQLVAYEL
jgi:hypothetical protein